MKPRLVVAAAIVCSMLLGVCSAFAAGESQGLQQYDLFVSGQDGYRTYRIPALIVSQKGTVLAFCEGRKNSSSDTGDIDLVLKRSTDGGKTWGPQQIVWDDAQNTCGNPCPVVDQQTGVIWLLLTWNRGDDHERDIIAYKSKDTRRVFMTSSADDGLTWAKPREITQNVKKNDWTWYATGPGNGIQVTRGAHAGRLVIPCDYVVGKPPQYFSHVIYSDDHGKTWQLGGASPKSAVNEATVVELADGRLMLNMRNFDRQVYDRQVCFSCDGGLTWEGQYRDKTLVEPRCEASILRYSWPDGDEGRILFSNPAGRKREKMTVRMSTDEGKTWKTSRCLHAGPAAYSCLTRLPDGKIADFYEGGVKSPYEKIIFAAFPLDWLQE